MTTSRIKRRELQKRKNTALKISFFVFIFITLVTTVGFTWIRTYIKETVIKDTMYPGIIIDGIVVDGMTKDETEALLAEKNQSRLEQYKFILKYGDQEWKYDYRDIQAKLNIKEIVDKAYEQGRRGKLLSRIRTIWDLESNPMEFNTRLTYNVDVFRDELRKLASIIDKTPVDAIIKFYPEEEKMFDISTEEVGYELQIEKILKEIESQLTKSPSFELELDVEEKKPQVIASDLKKLTKKIASFSTDVSTSSQNRKQNVFLSMGQFNGMVINPGQVVSFNETTGQRTKENGYLAAPVIKWDKSLEDELGGGVCQSSSTIYNAVLYAGLEIVQRTHHSFPSTYVSKGLDATVNWPNLDLKFKNNRNTPVFLRTYNYKDRVYIEVYGEPLPEGHEVKLLNDVYKTYPAPQPNVVKDTKGTYVTYEDQTYTKVVSRPGYKVKSYRVIYKDGQEISRELLADDYYRPIQGLIYKGTKSKQNASPQ